jgi:hypothetical protein
MHIFPATVVGDFKTRNFISEERRTEPVLAWNE